MAQARFALGDIVNMNPVQDYDIPAKIIGIILCIDGTVNYWVSRYDMNGGVVRYNLSEFEISELKEKK